MKRIVPLVLLVFLGASSVATGIPVRNVDLYGEGNTGVAQATFYSPPTAATCGAYYAMIIVRNAPGNPPYATRSGRVNVCRDSEPGGSGWSRGEVILSFDISRWPEGHYRVCFAASQVLTNASTSHHAARANRRL